MSTKPGKIQCKAKSKRTGERCKAWAVPGYKVCYNHGAGGGAPKGSKNSLTTGEHETIWLDMLTEEEQSHYHQVNTDKLRQLDEEIRLLSIRERRMLERIRKVNDGWEDQSVAETYSDGQVTTKQTATKSTLSRLLAIEEALTRVQAQKSKLIEIKHKIESDGGEGDLPALDRFLQGLNDIARSE